ncbi:MAG: hypothetical protein HYU66_21230 [Armatimonadetes bacterium]|nr:hypothetical protein [Armatimonadota bacterium]
MTRAFRLEALGVDGGWCLVAGVEENHQRLVRVDVDVEAVAVRLVVGATWGAETAHVFAFDVR